MNAGNSNALSPMRRWRHWLGIVLVVSTLLALPTSGVRAATIYYVATTGSDSNAGTSLAAPFRTINKCATVAVAGDTCQIRAGTYRETANVANSGTAGAPITFMPYNNEKVIVSGTDVITNWTAHDLTGSKRIYRASMPFNMNVRSSTWPNYQSTNNQIFVDGKMMPEARWPNIPIDQVTRQANAYQARSDGATNHAVHSVTYTDSALSSFTTNFWQGAKINFSPGFKIAWTTCDVTASTTSSVSLQCNPDPGQFNRRSELDLPGQGDFYIPGPQNPYYLWGKYGALDAAGEWFRDAAGTLYLWTPDGSSPSTKVVEARARPYAFNLWDRAHITIQGLQLFAAGIRTSNSSDYLTIDGIEAYYTWHFQEIPAFYGEMGTRGLMLGGDHSVIQNSVLGYSAGAIANLSYYYDSGNPPQTHNRFINNVAFDTSYMANQPGITGVNAGGGAGNHLMEHNTMFYSGAVLVDMALGHIRYNDVYQSHQQISDLGTIYTWNSDGHGSETAYNFVHDNYGEWNQTYSFWGGNGIYPDDNARNYVIHHNIIWGHTSNGIATFGLEPSGAGGYRKFYNNTVDGSMSFLLKPERQQTNVGTEVRNNIVAIKTAGDGYDDPNLIKSNNLLGNGLYVNRPAADYRLRADSPAINAGMVLAPYTNGFVGAAPDIGALEFGGSLFMAGAKVRTGDVAALTASCQQDSAGDTATCTVSNLPLGRKLPLDFELRIGTATAGVGCWTVMNYTTHLGTATCRGVPTGGQSGTLAITGRLAGGAWTTLGNTSLGNLAIFNVSPNNGPTSGGTNVTITGRRFQPSTSGVSFGQPITINNPNSTKLYDYQVPVVFNSAALISAGKMRSDCGDIRFTDAYGLLSYWLEEGCNTTTTRVWVRVLAIPVGNSTITLTYGDNALTSASNGTATFFFFDDFANGTASEFIYWDAPPAGVTIQETGGAVRVNGTTNSGNQYNSWGPQLRPWLFQYSANFAVDSELTVASGPNNFKATMGNWDMGIYHNGFPKRLGYYSGSWIQLGTSTISTATFTRQKISIGHFGPNATGKTVYWYENGNTATARATRTTSGTPNWGGFRYGPDTVASFDARFDNIRVRNFVYPEPQTTTGTETVNGAQFSFGGTACLNLRVIDSTSATCQTPNHSAGTVPVAITNPGGASASWTGYTYTSGTLIAPTQISPTGAATVLTPTYSWSEASAATRYLVNVFNVATGTAVVNQEVTAASVCVSGTCSFTPGTALQNNGNYTWYVAGGNASAWGPWSSGLAFTVNLPLSTAPTLVAPTGITTGDLTPTYTWTGVAGATAYALAAFDLETSTLQFFQSFSASTICVGLNCQVTPTGTGTTLLNGRPYGWFVAAGNFAGWGPWSSGLAFYAFVTPEVPTLVAPNGATANPVTYQWNRTQGATAYYLATYRIGESTPLYESWFTAADICTASSCQVNHPGSLSNSSYAFYVLAQNPAGISAFSNPMFFTVGGGTAPEIAPTFAP